MKQLYASVVAILIAGSAQALSLDEIMDLTVRTGWREADGTHVAGIDIQLADGWKTYWRQPGDAGIPPRFDWSTSANFLDADIMWPTPKVDWTDGMRSIGYSEQVVFPMIVTPRGSGPVQLSGILQIGLCEEICIPVQVRVSATLPSVGAPDQILVNAMAAQVSQGTGHVQCSFEPTTDAMAVTLRIPKTDADAPDVAVEVAESGMWIAQPAVTDGGTHWVATTEVLAPSGTPPSVARSGVVVTAFGDGTAHEYRGCRAVD